MKAFDADKLLDILDVMIVGHKSASDVYDVVDSMPTVDAVEVVRCKDCIHRYHDSKYGYMCVMDSADPHEQSRGVDDGEWYCADGERRQDGNEPKSV